VPHLPRRLLQLRSGGQAVAAAGAELRAGGEP
jgi:hypothetical protein